MPKPNITTPKKCKDCREIKPVSEYYLCTSRGVKRLQTYCKACSIQRSLKWLRENKHRQNIHRRSRMYGISPDGLKALIEVQNSKCLICKKTTKVLCIDHCHLTGLVRGLLCTQCNTGIAMFRDDIGLLEEAIEYLRSAEEFYLQSKKKSQ